MKNNLKTAGGDMLILVSFIVPLNSAYGCSSRTTILVIIFWNSATFKYNFDTPQVKWSLMSNIKNFLHKLSHKLLNDFEGSYEIWEC